MITLYIILSWCTSVVAAVVVLITSFQLAVFTSSQEANSSPLNFRNASVSKDAYLYPALWNASLLGMFILQHSGMATMCWKNLMADLKLYTISRAIYVILTSSCLQLLMYHWQPLPTSSCLWFIDTTNRPGLWLFFFLVHLVAWLIITAASFFMDLAELIGFKQVYYEQKGKNIPLLYKSHEEQKLLKHMRHPGTTCFLLILWLHPMMTLQRLFLSIAWTLYVLFGFSVSEKDYTYVRHQRLVTVHRSVTEYRVE